MQLDAQTMYGFTNSLLISRFDNPVPSPRFHLKLWELMCDPHDKVAVAAPRGHAKSTAVTHAFVLANICFRLKQHIMVVSDTEAQSVNFLGDIKTEFIENEELISAFEIKRLAKDREAEIIIEFNDGHRVRVIAKGAEQKVRGTKWRNIRPDLIVGDDLENDEAVMNEERRVKFRNWFFSALCECGGDDTQIRIVGTVLHMDSLLERLMPEFNGKFTESTPLYDYSTKPNSVWKSIRFRAHDEDFSNILWPERWNKEHFIRKRAGYVEQGNPAGYAQEFLNYPVDESTAYFQKRDFLPIQDNEEPLQYYVACDLAISEKKSRAYTVFAVAAVNSKGKLKFKDIIRFRGDSLEIIDELFRVQNIYKPEIFFIEQENIARALGPVLNKAMQERQTYLSIQPMQATKDKIQRARALQARMRAGMVEFDTEAEWYPGFQQEFLQFPRGAYMDQVDAASWIALGLDQIVDAPSGRDLLEDEWEQEIEDSYYSNNDYGRNSTTGY
jgi:predicted phage terminase large subunit-like protein